GLFSLYLYKLHRESWQNYALISLVLTFCSGLQAIAYWAFIKDFNLTWWAFNLYLMVYPLLFIKLLINNRG
ncbi:DUF5360 family protein, partial [Priestia megaterium]|uniref:DUF5360 family protein n=2 Tax=Bacillaceae TaxID=186817 RepID=UPI002FFEC44F